MKMFKLVKNGKTVMVGTSMSDCEMDHMFDLVRDCEGVDIVPLIHHEDNLIEDIYEPFDYDDLSTPVEELLGHNTPRYIRHRELLDELHEMYVSKNKEYGNSFSKAHEDLGIMSGVAQLYHKMQRLITIVDKEKVTHESIEDTLRDMANYSIMLLMEIEKENENEKYNRN